MIQKQEAFENKKTIGKYLSSFPFFLTVRREPEPRPLALCLPGHLEGGERALVVRPQVVELHHLGLHAHGEDEALGVEGQHGLALDVHDALARRRSAVN